MKINPCWDWAFEGSDAALELVAPSPAFTTRYDAEEWLGGIWRTLASQGVSRAILRHDGDRVNPVELSTREAGQDG